jgi:hypothetical protein
MASSKQHKGVDAERSPVVDDDDEKVMWIRTAAKISFGASPFLISNGRSIFETVYEYHCDISGFLPFRLSGNALASAIGARASWPCRRCFTVTSFANFVGTSS